MSRRLMTDSSPILERMFDWNRRFTSLHFYLNFKDRPPMVRRTGRLKPAPFRLVRGDCQVAFSIWPESRAAERFPPAAHGI